MLLLKGLQQFNISILAIRRELITSLNKSILASSLINGNIMPLNCFKQDEFRQNSRKHDKANF